jgi:hypothetical protein
VLGNAEKMEVTGITPADLVSLGEGTRRTVEWFAENEGDTWERP